MEAQVKRILTAFLVVVTIASGAFAQKGVEDGSKYGHGEDSIRALTHLSMYKQFYKQKGYNDAIKSWRVVYSEAPKASRNMYLHGVNMYKIFYQKSKTPEVREKYVDSIMEVYNQRIEYWGDEGYYTARKAVDLYALDSDAKKEVYDMMHEAMDIMTNQTPDFALNVMMQTALSLYLDEEITKDNMVNNFAEASDIISFQLKSETNQSKREQLEQVQANVELIFTQSGAADCESLIPVLKPRFEENPDDIENLKNIVSLLRKRDCEASELYEKSAEALYKIEPSANAAYGLARVFLKKENWEKTTEYYKEAINNEEDDITKARYYKELAEITLVSGSPSQAVGYASEALKLNPNDGDPYLTIGKAYANVKNFGDNKFQARTIYWVAVDMFQRAKSVDTSTTDNANKLISIYSQYFPDKEEAFFHDVTEGSSYKVGGWINRTTTARFN
ncbi:MAG: hypothetical protein PF489_12315 [Salinivirgaceae bacterium]|jgi:tetratricopeptide (TPR) repeat protein|nr:hypothetical protein [Salinivirgaceae bacterium]